MSKASGLLHFLFKIPVDLLQYTYKNVNISRFVLAHNVLDLNSIKTEQVHRD